uniref:Uncharacterized protein n=1 Tax=Candidatus Kentrum sp. TUN TaxID=2126343 RepID=A0A450ZWG1_9GAMM|nr:MAG: hypothetical protein BECKTUN1418D_GA0071000_107511 [Candidatus Kentron sp. TUN]
MNDEAQSLNVEALRFNVEALRLNCECRRLDGKVPRFNDAVRMIEDGTRKFGNATLYSIFRFGKVAMKAHGQNGLTRSLTSLRDDKTHLCHFSLREKSFILGAEALQHDKPRLHERRRSRSGGVKNKDNLVVKMNPEWKDLSEGSYV